MTNQPNPALTLRELFGDLAGMRIPSGCDCCNAYQTMRTDEPGIHRITVHHDDWCPDWQRRQGKPPTLKKRPRR